MRLKCDGSLLSSVYENRRRDYVPAQDRAFLGNSAMSVPATIYPLCDKDATSMSIRRVLIDDSDADLLTAYVCTKLYCDRCYNEGAGYFDFIGGRPHLDDGQILCEADAMPMFLEIALSDDCDLWRCPGCNGVAVRSR